MEVLIKILLFCFSCNMPFLPNSCSFSLILLINLCRALRRIIKEWGITIFRTNYYVESYFYGYSCVLLDSEYVLHFVSSLINFRSFSASKFVLCQFFVLKSFRMPRIVFFKRKQIFFQVKFFFIFKKSYLCLKLFTVLCFCCEAFTLGKGRVHLMSFEFIFFSLISMLQIISFPFL